MPRLRTHHRRKKVADTRAAYSDQEFHRLMCDLNAGVFSERVNKIVRDVVRSGVENLVRSLRTVYDS